jgi:gas vesicle protein
MSLTDLKNNIINYEMSIKEFEDRLSFGPLPAKAKEYYEYLKKVLPKMKKKVKALQAENREYKETAAKARQKVAKLLEPNPPHIQEAFENKLWPKDTWPDDEAEYRGYYTTAF